MRILILLLISIQGFGQLLPVTNSRSRVPQDPPVDQPDTARFNFSATSQPVDGWTNVVGSPSSSIRIATDPTGIAISTISTDNINRWNPNGNTAFDGVGLAGGTFFPAAVMMNSYVNDGAYSETYPQFRLSNLDPAKTYKLRVSGSTTGGSLRSTSIRWKADGTISAEQIYNAKNNTANGATFTGVVPSAAGWIDVYVSKGSSNEQGQVSGIEIIEEIP